MKTEEQKGKDIVSKKCALSFVNKHTFAYWLLLLLLLLLLLFSFYAGVAWERADMNGYLFSFYSGALARSGAEWVKTFGYLCIHEILIMTKSSVRRPPLHVSGCEMPK